MALNENQIKAINKDNGNVAVIATAGSGKTTVIINRIKRLITECSVAPENILAVTFSKKAKENIQNKLPDECCGVNVETFHSVALKIVQDYAHGTYELWVKSWEKEKCLFDICKGLGLCAVKEDMPYNDILKFIATQKTNMRKSDNLIYDIDLPFTNSNMKIIYDEYEEYKEHHAYIEFDDLLNMACEIFEESPETLEKYQNIYTYILADEFQDVSLNQALFLKHLSAKNNNLFVVGDGCQAIYQFRGGISKYLLDFDTEWAGADTINLNTNYRCSKDIVTTANELAKYLPESKNKHYVEAMAHKEANSKPIYIECNTASEEANIVADEISKLIANGKKYEDVCLGDGPIDAAFKAIDKIVKPVKHTFDFYTINSISEGKDTLGDVTVKLLANNRSYVGRGLSTDIFEASILAYIKAINKMQRAYSNKDGAVEKKENSNDN